MKRHCTVLSFSFRSVVGSAGIVFAASLFATGCGAAAETEPELLGEADQEAASCGRPPPPRVCNRIRCIPADNSYEYDPLPAGTVCNGNRLCDGQGTCLPPPPALRTLNLPIDDKLQTEMRLLLGGTEISIDATGSGPFLVTGTHTECVDGPGPLPIICHEIIDSTSAFVRFPDGLKAFFNRETGQSLNDVDLGPIGAVCGGSTYYSTCVAVHRLSADLIDLGITLGGSGAAPTLSISLPLESAQPTLFVEFPFPNVDLDNMVARLSFRLGVADQRLRVVSAGGHVDYDLNLTHFPDFLIAPFYDVDNKLYTELEQGVSAAFSGERQRDAIARALTQAISGLAKRNDPAWTGFREIHAVRNVNGTLQIDFVPN